MVFAFGAIERSIVASAVSADLTQKCAEDSYESIARSRTLHYAQRAALPDL